MCGWYEANYEKMKRSRNPTTVARRSIVVPSYSNMFFRSSFTQTNTENRLRVAATRRRQHGGWRGAA
jgi:hypothetical protein